jgi:tetratricopeptide (TPR) repeat protein
MLAVQDEIVRAVVETGLHLRLEDQDRRRLTRHPSEDVEAYELYLRAIHRVERGTEEDYLAARDLLGQALAKDPAFALASAALATTYAVLAVDGFARPIDAWPESARHVKHALEREPDLPDAHAAAASIAFFFERDWGRADREWQLALQARGGDVDATFLIAYALQQWALGRPDAARELAHRARMRDPLSPAFMVKEADFLLSVGRLAEAAGLYNKALREAPDDPPAYFGLAETRSRQGRFDEALAARRRGHVLTGDDALVEVIAAARGAEGYRQVEHATAPLQIASLDARAASGGYASPLDYARCWAVLGDRGRAMSYLEDAFADRAPGLVFLGVDRAWDTMREEPAFRGAARRAAMNRRRTSDVMIDPPPQLEESA